MKFNNPELQKIYEESKPIIKAHLDNINDINNDIKILEGLFKTSCGAFEYNSWCKDGYYLSFKYKRLYCKYENIEKPLIECKLNIRLKMAPYLSVIMKYFIEHLGE